MDSKGGLAVGNSHAEGGIKATVKSTNQNIEFEGGEVIVNKKNVADETLLEFEGEKKTTCEILSDLNSRNNNGVTLDCDSVEGKKYKFERGGIVEPEIVFSIENDYYGNLELGKYTHTFNNKEKSSGYFQGVFYSLSEAFNNLVEYVNSENGIYILEKESKSNFEIKEISYDGKSNDSEGYPIIKDKTIFKISAKKLKELIDLRRFEKGGMVEFIGYKDKEIMFEPNYNEYFVDDEQFKTLEEAQAFIDSGSPISDWKKDAYSKGMFEKGGMVEFIDLDTYRKYNPLTKKIWENYINSRGQQSVGAFAHKYNDKVIRDYYLFLLDDFDRDYYSHIKLQPFEMIFRYETDNSKIGGLLPLVKINISNGSVYLMKDLYDDDDKNIKFDTKKLNISYISMNQRIKLYFQGLIKYDEILKNKYNVGGSVSDSENINYEDWKINNKKNLFAKNGVKLPEIHYPENSLGISRHELPQVQTNYIHELVSDLQEDNIDFNYLLLNPKDLKPCQKEINLHKVNSLTDEYIDKKYIIVSNDGYVLDGHHSWYCCCQKDKKIKALQIDMPIRKLIDYLHKFRFVEYENIDTPNKLFKNGGNVDDLGHDEKLVNEVMTKLVPKPQLAYLNELKRQDGEDAVEIKDVLLGVIEAYKYMPNIYEQDGKGYNSVVRIHYFVGGTDWYITEMDKQTGKMFGYTVLNGDYEMAEFGYIDSEFLIDNNLPPLSKPQLDFYWNYQTINEILEKEEPSMVRPPIVRYQEQKTTIEKTTLISKDWQALIKENKFKNPFEKVKAIEEMIDEKGDNPDNYSVIEKNFISQYTGIGGMEKYGAKMRDVGKGKELDFGLLYEFFTPNDLARIMWGLAFKHQEQLTIKNVLEPSMGAGAFISQAPLNVNIDGYDINKYCYIINKVLYRGERFNFYHESFEKLFISKNSSVKDKVFPKYDLVIGNPPYGEYNGYYAVMGEKKHTSADDYIDYFISRGLDLLLPNGLLVFIIGSVSNLGGVPFLDKKMTKSKAKIMAKCELVDAYRLGRNMFEFTEVDADIIVLRKK